MAMGKKMHSFRLDEGLIMEAKRIANKLNISLSALVTLALVEKIDRFGQDKSHLKKIAEELALLRHHFEENC